MVKHGHRLGAWLGRRLLASSFLSLFSLCCSTESTAPETTGGVGPGSTGACPSGLVVVLSDYLSTQVALSALDGTTLSEAFISTASTQASGLAFALSGDVVVPRERPASGRVVLLDRFGTNVITWVDPSTAEVLGQLPVGTGFESNPQDYLEIDSVRGYVTRWGHNPDPGQQPFDQGSDVLVIDTQQPQILDRIGLPEVDGLPPRPTGMVRMGSQVAVMLQPLSLDFSTAAEAVLVGIDPKTGSTSWQLRLEGLKNCGTPALAPDQKRAAIACSGQLGASGEVADLGESGVVLLDVTQSPPVELRRFAALELAGEALQSEVAFATGTLLLLKSQTPLLGSRNNRVLLLDLDQGTSSELLEAAPDDEGLGKGAVYGSLWCAPGCSDTCLMADADQGVLQRWRVTGNELEPLAPVTVESRVGLPPHLIGSF